MNLFADLRGAVVAALDALVAEGALPAGLDYSAVAVEPPRDAAHGDMATNAAMVLARPAGQNPRALAEALVAHLAADARVAGAEVAGPGFINLTLEEGVWRDELTRILAEGADYGRGDAAVETLPINVE